MAHVIFVTSFRVFALSMDSLVLVHGLSSWGAWALLLCSIWDLSSPTRDGTCVSCIARWILNHWTIRKSLGITFCFVAAFTNCGHNVWVCSYNLKCSTQCAARVLVSQSCPTLFDPINCSLPGSSVCGISQARILECVAIPFSGGASQPRDWTQVSHIAGRFFTIWATRKAHSVY